MIKRLCNLFVLFVILFGSGCTGDKMQQDIIKWQLTLERKDKRPYGTYLAYESLKYYFKDAEVETLSGGFRFTSIDSKMTHPQSGRSLMILEGIDFYVSDKEWTALKEYVSKGNEVFLFCNRLDSKISEELNCYEQSGTYRDLYGQSHSAGNNRVLTLADQPERKYGYEGRSVLGNFITKEELFGGRDTTIAEGHDSDSYDSASEHETPGPNAHEDNGREVKSPVHDTAWVASLNASGFCYSREILGYAGEKPDIFRYSFGDGHLTIHAAPLTLSNYFLIQDGNRDYLTALWQSLPDNITHIYWNEYFHRHAGASDMDVLWKYPQTAIAMILAILAMLVYILFEMKRKQRIIPIIQPLKNDSVSFVETVGRLYYNKGNHKNLADKMTLQFLEWVRNHYFLNTNLLNEYFIEQLTIKSGQPEATVRGLTDMIIEIKSGAAKTDDAYLYQLYNTIQLFYKNHSK